MAITRLQRFRETLADLHLDGMIISTPENRRYLSGFTGSSGVLLISESQAFIITDFRYWEQVALEVGEFELAKQGPDLWRSVMELIEALKWQKIGFEANNLTFHEYQTLSDSASSGLRFIPTTDLVEKLRWVKEPGEIETLVRATEITDLALQKTLTIIKPGVTEEMIALEFDYQLRAGGAEGSAFTTIVASGERAALPHGAASGKPVANGDLVIIDGGAIYKGYHGDLTRTVVIGKANSRQQEIYQIVLQAQEKALAFLKAGLVGNVVDGVAREFIAGQGYGEYFGHGLGHSVGLNIHERPRLSITEQSVIPAGVVITVEPGIYLPGWGGVRIEDLVVVEENGVRNLTKSPKESLVEI
jgi:Xaa-Pro aminopeptidase